MNKKCGHVAIIGRPNVGKSTLLNHILKQKISITSRKPQTTREQILGIKTENNIQTIYVDTPGIHQYKGNALNRYMNRTANSAIFSVDVIVFVVDSEFWKAEEDAILAKIIEAECPVILAINKVDTIKDKKTLFPLIEAYAKKYNFAAIIPISGKQSTNLDALENTIAGYLPEHEFEFPEDEITNKSLRFMTAEVVREKIMRCTGQELPYSVALEIEQFVEEEKLFRIAVRILIEKENQKMILIGAKGSRLKEIGTQARLDLEKLLDKKVFLQLWVKVKQGWSDDERALKSLGYGQ
jgi:GTP-binding protein Era